MLAQLNKALTHQFNLAKALVQTCSRIPHGTIFSRKGGNERNGFSIFGEIQDEMTWKNLTFNGGNLSVS